MKKINRLSVLMILVGSLFFTGCDASKITDVITKVAEGIKNAIPEIKGVIDAFKGDGDNTDAVASDNAQTPTDTSAADTAETSTSAVTKVTNGVKKATSVAKGVKSISDLFKGIGNTKPGVAAKDDDAKGANVSDLLKGIGNKNDTTVTIPGLTPPGTVISNDNDVTVSTSPLSASDEL